MFNPTELIRGVDAVHREKNISKDIIFDAIESAVQLAAEKFYGEEQEVVVTLDRSSGEMHARLGEQECDLEKFGRIAAQAAKQALIQKIREGECNYVFDIYAAKKGDLIHGTVQRFEGGAATVTIDKHEALLPRSEQIPGETHHVGERVKAIILDVRKVGHRVKIILSRTHPDFVRRLFELEIPEIADRTIEIKAVAREAGYRSKVAVSSIDMKVDCVGACVGVRGSRIKNIVDELGGERIDIVRWNDSLQVLIPNSLQPASVEEVFLYPRLGRAIVLVKEDQLSLAIGRRGQNVRLASKLVGWDIEIMTHDELTEGIDRATTWFLQIPNVTDEMVEAFIEEGFLSYDDLTFLEPAQLGELAGIGEEAADDIIAFAEEAAEQVEEEQKAAAASGEGGGGRKKVAVPPTAAEGARQAFDALFAAPSQEGSATATEEPPAPAAEEPVPVPEGEQLVAVEAEAVGEVVQVVVQTEPEAEGAEPSAAPEPETAEPGQAPEEKPADETLM
ncbi:MAG TPA: transcription termination factor NusA [Gemmataceae bacterium]|nr:transcription termination factor NusA [Gemmataceae bacterium]